jgi:hypothetical protein
MALSRVKKGKSFAKELILESLETRFQISEDRQPSFGAEL